MHPRTPITGLLLLALLGCGGGQRPADAAPATFVTQILANDTKLFTFTLQPERPEQGRRKPSLDGPGAEGGPGGPPRQRGPSSTAAHRQLEALLAQNRYCREGYLTLQQYGLYGGYTIRGECRDGADADDRSRFPERNDARPGI